MERLRHSQPDGANERVAPLPRLVRFRDAPFYLGMDRNRLNVKVRPQLKEIPIGTQGIAFDRLELDAWVEQYKSRIGRPAQQQCKLTWDEREPRSYPPGWYLHIDKRFRVMVTAHAAFRSRSLRASHSKSMLM